MSELLISITPLDWLLDRSICGLVGMNGAGKSTFFKALMGFVRPSRGKIRLNGLRVNQAQKDQTVAYVPQNEGIDYAFPVSVWDVVMMGRYGSIRLQHLWNLLEM